MKVFISHSDSSRELAMKVAEGLRGVGLEVWDSERDILPGDNWAEKIAQALRESEAMVVLLTPEALRSGLVRREIDYALGARRFSSRLIPVIVGSEEDFREESLPWILRHLNPIKLPGSGKGEEDGIRRIAQALQAAA